jgi:hypothetical protein
MLAGQVIVHVTTVTVNMQVDEFGTVAASVAVHVTDVVPIGKQVPELGEQTTVDPGQLSPIAGLA